jgi:osmoprotectant transport system ATP-binding protein
MLTLHAVTKCYGGVTVLHPTDLTVPAGRTTVLIGPSGSGKSTLLRLMAGLVAPTAGTVLLGGEPVTPASARSLRRRIGFVVQDGGLVPHLTARGNVTLMARHLGRDLEHIDARLNELAELTHFPVSRFDAYPVQLSGGQRQRVSLMRALMLEPNLLLLDEPLGALDPLIRSELQGELRDIFRSLGKTVVLVTHDLGEAAFLGDKLVVLQAGRVVQEGTFDDLVNRPADPFVTKFVNAQRSVLGDREGVTSVTGTLPATNVLPQRSVLGDREGMTP